MPEAAQEALAAHARKMAETQGIDLSSVAGSGPNGRIVKRDVEEAMSAPAAGKKAAPIFSFTIRKFSPLASAR